MYRPNDSEPKARKQKINDMIDNDREMESLLASAMHKVGKAHDESLISQMSSIDEDAFRAELAKSKIQVRKGSWFTSMVHSPYFRASAACIICALLIWGVAFLPLSESKTSGYASMFNQYYTEYTATTFDAQGDRLNAHGKKSTAQLIQDASELLSQSSRKSTYRSIEILKWLLDNPYRKTSLDPEIHWYLGLAYLKDGQKANACAQFEIVRASSNPHASEANLLLKQIKRLR